MIKAVIFDMDGLIINNEDLQSLSFDKVIKEYGKIPIYNKYGTIHKVGVKGSENWPHIKKRHGINEKLDILKKKKRNIYFQLLKSRKLKTRKGIFKLINLLNKKGIKKGLASGSPIKHINYVLKNLKLKKEFEIIVAGDKLKKGKPDPEIYFKAAKKIGVSAENCLALEDAESGIIAAKKAGMKAIAIPNQYTKHQDFSKADKIVDSLSDITISIINSL